MAKISRHGGASDATLPTPEPEVEADETAAGTEPDAEETLAVVPVTEPEAEGGEESSAGSSSETSTEKPSTPPEPSEALLPKRARKMASRSRQAPTGNSSAPSTDGGQTEATSASDEAGE